MGGDYFGFVASAYGVSAFALIGLGLWIVLDSRAARRDLERLEEASGRRQRKDAP